VLDLFQNAFICAGKSGENMWRKRPGSNDPRYPGSNEFGWTVEKKVGVVAEPAETQEEWDAHKARVKKVKAYTAKLKRLAMRHAALREYDRRHPPQKKVAERDGPRWFTADALPREQRARAPYGGVQPLHLAGVQQVPLDHEEEWIRDYDPQMSPGAAKRWAEQLRAQPGYLEGNRYTYEQWQTDNQPVDYMQQYGLSFGDEVPHSDTDSPVTLQKRRKRVLESSDSSDAMVFERRRKRVIDVSDASEAPPMPDRVVIDHGSAPPIVLPTVMPSQRRMLATAAADRVAEVKARAARKAVLTEPDGDVNEMREKPISMRDKWGIHKRPPKVKKPRKPRTEEQKAKARAAAALRRKQHRKDYPFTTDQRGREIRRRNAKKRREKEAVEKQEEAKKQMEVVMHGIDEKPWPGRPVDRTSKEALLNALGHRRNLFI
jgi:hypothetical protein